MYNNRANSAYVSQEAINKARELGMNGDFLDTCQITKNSLEAADCLDHRGIYEYLFKEHKIQMDNNIWNANNKIIHRYYKSGMGLFGFEEYQQKVWNEHRLVNDPSQRPMDFFVGTTKRVHNEKKELGPYNSNRKMSRDSRRIGTGNAGPASRTYSNMSRNRNDFDIRAPIDY